MWGCVLGAALFLGAIVNGPQRSPLRFDEWHHEYAGAAACAIGAATHSSLIVRIGGLASFDDGTQHMYQRVNRDLSLRSPLNVGYRITLGRLPIFERLGGFLDRVLR